jgi:hypothetical protein
MRGLGATHVTVQMLSNQLIRNLESFIVSFAFAVAKPFRYETVHGAVYASRGAA